MIVVDPMVPAVSGTCQLKWGFVELLIGPSALAVWPLCRRAAKIAARAHRAPAVVAVNQATERVDRDVVVVDAERVALADRA